MDTINAVINALCDEAFHFWFALALGLLGFSWMWTTLFAGLSGVVFFTHRWPSMAVVYGILICCLLAGLSAVLASHWLLDYASLALQAPLGPPLWGAPDL